MALPSAFLDELRARTPMQPLAARHVKLRRSGRNWTGCCPFHNEKTPSFYVYEDGFHCFGCGAHGDAISFVMQTAGTSFIETVEQLAAEAGLDVPKPSRWEVAAEQERLDLYGVLDLAQAEFARLLHTKDGAAAFAYLRGRGLSDATIARFGLGWSGEGRGSLQRALSVEPALLTDAGLLRAADEGGPAREFFWNRVTFPIRDRKGRVIGFGGRTLGDGKPKYVNGPETRLFLKKHALYALDLAREAVRRGARLVVCEGYMDVIALHQAGFAGAVAPLGTALTAEQLEALWRLSPTPVLCFDGDAAGARAAARVAGLCLPLLTPERSLSFATLPAGKDPDDLVRDGGSAAFEQILAEARPLVDALYALLGEGTAPTPEARAALRTRLDAAAASIPDKTLAAEYRTALRDRFFNARRRGAAPPAHRPARSLPSADDAHAERARCLTALLLRHPALLRDTEEAFASLDLPPYLHRLREAILHIDHHAELDSAALVNHLQSSGSAEDVARVLRAGLPLPRSVRSDASPAEAEGDWWHLFGLLHGQPRLDREVAEAARAHKAEQTDVTARRLVGLRTAQSKLVELDADIE